MSRADEPLSILLLDDDEEDAGLTQEALERAGAYEVRWVQTLRDGLAAAAEGRFDAYLVDYRLRGETGIDFIRTAQEEGLDGPFIVLTGQGVDATDIEALRAGASDYLVKRNLAPELLARSIRHALERKALQARVRETYVGETVGLLAGRLAHEYNNRLMAVLAHISLAQRAVGPGAGDVRRHLDVAESAARGAAELTSRILAFYGRPTFRPASVPVGPLLAMGIELACDLAQERVAVEVRAEDDVPMLWGDEALLAQLLANVLLNAHEAAPDTPPEVDVTAKDDRRHVVVRVSDRGPGLDDETRERAFEPFFTTKEFGRGLGLAAASAIARLHEGTIELDSPAAAGTVVTIRLPWRAGSGTPSRSAAAPPRA